MKEYYLSKNKYIRLRVVKYYAYFRADISVNKYAFNGNVPCRYYEINFIVLILMIILLKKKLLKKQKNGYMKN